MTCQKQYKPIFSHQFSRLNLITPFIRRSFTAFFSWPFTRMQSKLANQLWSLNCVEKRFAMEILLAKAFADSLKNFKSNCIHWNSMERYISLFLCSIVPVYFVHSVVSHSESYCVIESALYHNPKLTCTQTF